MVKQIDTDYVADLFRKVSEIMYEIPIDFTPLEQEFGELRKGGGLTYTHLEHIANPDIWPFSNWYLWPAGAQIEEGLRKTDGLFVALETNNDIPHKERCENDKQLFDSLFKIFKHIELVSIILRFVDPDNFGIYSPPNAYYLNSPRGYSYGREYINYLGELRKYKEIYNLQKVAYTDMFIWALSMLQNKRLKALREEILNYFHIDIHEKAKRDIVNKFLQKETIGKSDFEQAKLYCELEVFDTAAKWAGYAFESAVRQKCIDNNIPVKIKTPYGKKDMPLKDCLEGLSQGLSKKKETLIKMLALRNIASHPPYHRFLREEVEFMMETVAKIEKW